MSKKNKQSKIKCDVHSCSFNDCKCNECNLDSIDVSCDCNKDECSCKEKTKCNSFQEKGE